MTVEIEHDEWLRVVADTEQDARRFFGVPDNWPVKFEGFDPRKPGRIWRVLATGLK